MDSTDETAGRCTGRLRPANAIGPAAVDLRPVPVQPKRGNGGGSGGNGDRGASGNRCNRGNGTGCAGCSGCAGWAGCAACAACAERIANAAPSVSPGLEMHRKPCTSGAMGAKAPLQNSEW